MPLSAAARPERAAWLQLVLTPGIGPVALRRLLEAFGLPEDILAAGRTRLAAVLDAPHAQALLAPGGERQARIEDTLAWAEHPQHHLLTLADEAYPARLLDIGDPPPLLFVDGDPAALSQASLAIVGSRHATRAGLEIAEAFARALAEQGLQIVSGLAQGIDAAAHRGALGGRAGTLAVVGTGVDLVYPTSHARLAAAIAQRSAVVSELPLGTTAQRANFPRRNRLIAGLSLGTLVVEAARQSGSLITARLAAEFGREVMAIPGSIHSPLSKGCHQLIRDGAKLVESAEDVLVELRAQLATAGGLAAGGVAAGGLAAARASDSARPPGERNGDSERAAVLEALGWDPVDPDTVAARCARPVGEVSAALVALELEEIIERQPDGRYQRCRP